MPSATPEDNEFAIRGNGSMYEILVADLAKKMHRRQVRVRWLGLSKLPESPPSYLYEDELEWIVDRKGNALST
jgi:hypothetical protein